MLSRISQFKQSLSDEFEQAVSPQRPLNDPVSVIERNAHVLRTETPDVKDIMIESDDESKGTPQPESGALSDAHDDQKPADSARSTQDGAAPTVANGAAAQEPSAAPSAADVAAPSAEKSAEAAAPDAAQDGTEEPPAERDLEDQTNANSTGGGDHSQTKNGDKRAQSLEEHAQSPEERAQSPEERAQSPEERAQFSEERAQSPEIATRDPSKPKAESRTPSRAGSAAPADSSKAISESRVPSRAGSAAPASRSAGGDVTEPLSRASVDSQRPDLTDTPVSRDDPLLAAKLAKFEKYEQKYPGLLKAYKTEKKKNELVRIYEKVLGEHTPCTSIAEPQELVNYLKGLSSRSEMQQKEIGSLTTELAKLKVELNAEKKKGSDLKQEFEKSKQRAEQQLAEARTRAETNAAAQLKSEETSQLREKVAALEQQLAESEAAGSVAARTQTTLRTQLDELGLRLAETQTELEVVRDELGESENRAQERLQELSSVRQALRSRDKDRRRSADEATGQIAVLTSEKEQLEAEVELLGRRIVRESEQLHVQLRGVRSQLREAESHAAELQRELDQHLSRQESAVPSRAPSIKPAEPAPDQGKADMAQAQAEATASGAVRANELLKQVNADNALRIEKLQKAQRALTADLEQLRSENQQLRRRSSITSSEGRPLDSQKQQAYLRNVLLSFIEHRDQRKILLPVLATLLGFEDGEEDKLLNSLK